jgi:hypothetical protein
MLSTTVRLSNTYAVSLITPFTHRRTYFKLSNLNVIQGIYPSVSAIVLITIECRKSSKLAVVMQLDSNKCFTPGT